MKADVVDLKSSKDLPEQLEIRRGIVVMKVDGSIPRFDHWPDGTTVNVIARDELKQLIDDAAKRRAFGS